MEHEAVETISRVSVRVEEKDSRQTWFHFEWFGGQATAIYIHEGAYFAEVHTRSTRYAADSELRLALRAIAERTRPEHWYGGPQELEAIAADIADMVCSVLVGMRAAVAMLRDQDLAGTTPAAFADEIEIVARRLGSSA